MQNKIHPPPHLSTKRDGYLILLSYTEFSEGMNSPSEDLGTIYKYKKGEMLKVHVYYTIGTLKFCIGKPALGQYEDYWTDTYH
jgi:hypothetical protein